jgi:hypothetical protein
LLPNGKVLVTAGFGNSGWLTSAELYEPESGTWTATRDLHDPRFSHTATLLPNGKVLVAGGVGTSGTALFSAELYDPARGTWIATDSLANSHADHKATLLPNGKVLVTEGTGTSDPTNAELYDPANGTWTATSSLTRRYNHTATLLPNGEVLVAGGFYPDYLTSAELYDVGLGFDHTWSPNIANARLSLGAGRHLRLTGFLFQGISQASSGGTQDSSSNYPIVQLRSIGNDQVTFLPVDPGRGWSDTSFTSVTVAHFPLGPAVVTVFTNGIPSKAKYLLLERAP